MSERPKHEKEYIRRKRVMSDGIALHEDGMAFLNSLEPKKVAFFEVAPPTFVKHLFAYEGTVLEACWASSIASTETIHHHR